MSSLLEKKANDRVILIGNGCVGSSFAFATVLKGVSRELGIIDINEAKTEGDVMDLTDSLAFCDRKKIFQAEYSDCKNADIVVITAGFPQKPGETRLELLKKNIILFQDIISNVMASGFDGIILVASNPVDILTYAAWKFSGLPHSRVIGSGTTLDSARLRKEIAEFIDINPKNVHAYILGEHGDSEFPVWSHANIGGLNISEWINSHPHIKQEKLEEIFEFVRDEAYYIIDRKGATFYGIAVALSRIVEAILKDEKSVLPLSVYLQGQYELDDIYIGIPAVIGREGIHHILEVPLSDKEQELLHKSANKLREALKEPFSDIK